MAKMTIAEFRKIKQRMIDYLNNADRNQDENELILGYYAIEEELLESDLSDIPFEEWEGIPLVAKDFEYLDLSKTHANIDFGLLEQCVFDRVNLKGCNVRGIEYIDYDEDTFDEEFVRNHPEYFPPKTLPPEMKEKFYQHRITIEDLITYPELRQNITETAFAHTDSSQGKLIRILGVENVVKLIEEFPEFMSYLYHQEENDFSYMGRIVVDINSIDKDNITSYETAKTEFFKAFLTQQSKSWGELEVDKIPQDLIDRFPQFFLEEGKIKEDLQKSFYSGELTVAAIRYYKDVLLKKDLSIATKRKKSVPKLMKMFGSLERYFSLVEKEFDFDIEHYLEKKDIDDLKELTDEEVKSFIVDVIRYELANGDRYNQPDLNKYYAYSKYLPIEDFVKEPLIIRMIDKFGFDLLLEFNEEYNWILDTGSFRGMDDTFLYVFAEQSQNDPNFENLKINNTTELHEYFSKLFMEYRKYLQKSGNYSYQSIVRDLGKYLIKAFPKHVITMEEVEGYYPTGENPYYNLISAFNGDTDHLLKLLYNHPKLGELLKTKDVIISNQHLQKLYESLDRDKFYEICTKYGSSILIFVEEISTKNNANILTILNSNQNPEQIINEYIYRKVNHPRTIDIRILPDSFKEIFPELFLKEDAPKELVSTFYGTKWWDSFHLIEPQDLKRHPEWVQYLGHIDIDKCFQPATINVVSPSGKEGVRNVYGTSMYQMLLSVFTKEELFNLMVEYGNLLSETKVVFDPEKGKAEFTEALEKEIYNKIINRQLGFVKEYLPRSIIEKHPELFITEMAPEELKRAYYKREISGQLLREHPEYIEYLEDIDLRIVVSNEYLKFVRVLETGNYTNKEILTLMNKYHFYTTLSTLDYVELQYCSKESIEDVLQKQIANSIIYHKTPYSEELIDYIGDEHPELFLSKDAPPELKELFYSNNQKESLSFALLKSHKEWLPYLKDKNILLSLKRNVSDRIASNLEKLFEQYGQEEALKIGMKNPESVMVMLRTNQLDLLSTWYERVNFVPHHVIMRNFPVEDIDKFVTSGKVWSRISRIETHNMSDEAREALLKASICFGVFDQDKDGINKIMTLFSDIPKKLPQEEIDKIRNYLSNNIDKYANTEKQTPKMAMYQQCLEQLDRIYERRENGEYILVINSQEHKDTISLMRKVFEEIGVSGVLTPEQSHLLFGAFQLKYSPDFRDFLLENMHTILTSDDYISQISNIQARWEEIKAYNSNINLTLDLAMAYIMTNSYSNVQVGNHSLANTVSSVGYSQEDFEKLQQIYNYGKTRVFSSIPRIKDTVNGYTYEIVKLDDPQALVIGKLTDCCQELDDAAESSMVHSMTDKNGRLIVVKDANGNVVAQSWVWRNKNVICFDNIEVPNKAFTRASREHKDRKTFTDEIFAVYQHAAEALLAKDEEMYKQLLEEGKITQEQYDALKLAKVTVGTGYNDVKESLQRNATLDQTQVAHPLEFTSPVTGSEYLYINDSNTQYVIAGTAEVPQSTMETITPYADEYIIYDDSNMREQDVLILQKLEVVTKKDRYEGNTQMYDFDDPVTNIAYNYNLHPLRTRIIMNPNFAIIYEKTDDGIIIGDILYNTVMHSNTAPIDITERVTLQMRMAMEQIGITPDNIDISRLDDGSKQMCSKALGLKEEIDAERGVSHGK